MTSDPLDPWVKGAAMLYTKEFFEEVKRHLNSGGAVTLFVQLYESNTAAVKSEIATFLDVFPNGVVWGNTNEGRGYDLVLLGTVDPVKIDVDAVQAKLQRPEYARMAQSLREIGMNSAVDLFSTYAGRKPDLEPWLRDATITLTATCVCSAGRPQPQPVSGRRHLRRHAAQRHEDARRSVHRDAADGGAFFVGINRQRGRSAAAARGAWRPTRISVSAPGVGPRRKCKKVITLDTRALNRTLLARQFLLTRARASVLDTLTHLVGMQAQIPNAPYVGLWSRLAGFRHEDLSDLITSRQAVRIALMRNTLHLVTADDCLAIRPVVQRVLARAYRKANPETLAAMVAAGRAIVEASPRTNIEIGRRLRAQFPRHAPMVLGYAIRDNVALVQIPPRGVWGQRCAPILATAESWIGRPLAPSSNPDGLFVRYLRAIQAASLADVQAWSGLPGLKADFERVRAELTVYRDEQGRELFDVPGGRLRRAASVAPVRFLPEYDNVLVAYSDRSRIIPAAHRERVMRQLGRPPVLVDGFVRAFWRVVTTRKAATLQIELFDREARGHRDELEAEGRRLLRFVAGDAHTHVQFTRA